MASGQSEGLFRHIQERADRLPRTVDLMTLYGARQDLVCGQKCARDSSPFLRAQGGDPVVHALFVPLFDQDASRSSPDSQTLSFDPDFTLPCSNWNQVPRKIMQTNTPSTLFQLAIVCLHFRMGSGLGFVYLGFCSSKICQSVTIASLPSLPSQRNDTVRSHMDSISGVFQISEPSSRPATLATLTGRSRSTRPSTSAASRASD